MAVAKPISSSPGRKVLCQVCGAWSSGLHFGVFTCEGCKCFYRRSIREGANYACAKDRGCEITMETRNSCRYCRFNKCLRLGMSKEGIKLGRRPKVECDPGVHQVYLRHDDPIKPPMTPNPGLSYHPWPPMGSIPTSGTIHIKTEITEACRIFGSTPPPYRSPFNIKKEPGETNYASGYNCQTDAHPIGTPYRPGIDTHKTEPWSDYGIARWKSDEDSRGQYGNPYIENKSRVPHCRPTAAWTPVQASPDGSGRGSVEPVQWDGSINNPTPLNIPDVQTGAMAAMAFANLYRDKTMGADQAVADTSAATSTGDRNNNSPGESIGGEDQKSYIELMPRSKPEKRIDRLGSNEVSKVKGQLQAPTQCHMTQILSSDMVDSSEGNYTQGLSTAIMKRSLCEEESPLTTKKSKLIRGERRTSVAPSVGISEILCELTKAYSQMQSGIMNLYKEYQHDDSGVAHSPTSQFSQILGSNDLSEKFCKQKREGLKQVVQTFVEFLGDKNPNWISLNSSDQIPLAFIIKICLLTEFSRVSERPRDGEEANISAEEAACLVALSLIYDKNLSKGNKDTNSDKQQITDDIREELKRKGFSSHKLQRLLEQQELNMSSLKTG